MTKSQQLIISYEQLESFQRTRQKLEKLCDSLANVSQSLVDKDILEQSSLQDLKKIKDKLKSKSFRVAVIGEFSVGKSTLLNALLGEKIQPVREIPCSSTVTVLKYGKRKQAICRYKNGTEKPISLNEYQQKAAIPEEVALGGNISEELAGFEIEEIIFEHPDLELCRNGVEIVDSPGLNEHPSRTAITQQLLKDTDAVIFLISAIRPLSQTEQELLQELKNKLNGGKKDQPAFNLFVVTNFMDLIRTEIGSQQVRQRIKNLVLGDNPLISGENRLHFISAQAVVDATSEDKDNNYLKYFQDFINSLQDFLINERGIVELDSFNSELKRLIDCYSYQIHEYHKSLEDDLKDEIEGAEQNKHYIFEQIGEFSGRNNKIIDLANQSIDIACNQTLESWNQWVEGLGERIAQQSEHWVSNNQNQEKIWEDYAKQFEENLSTELYYWLKNEVESRILFNCIQYLDNEIYTSLSEIQATIKEIQQNNKNIGQLKFSNSSEENNLDFDDFINIQLSEQDASEEGGGWTLPRLGIGSEQDASEEGGGWFLGGLGIGGGATATALFLFTGLGFLPITLIAGVAGLLLGGLFGETEEEVKARLKGTIINKGLENFYQLVQPLYDKVCVNIVSVFEKRTVAASIRIEQAILILENSLEKNDKYYEKGLKKYESNIKWVTQKNQLIEQIKIDLGE